MEGSFGRARSALQDIAQRARLLHEGTTRWFSLITVTGAADPILKGAWLSSGTHVNLVGSSGPAQAEAE